MRTSIFYGQRARHLVSPALAPRWVGILAEYQKRRKEKRRPDDDQLLGTRLRNDWLQTRAEVDDVLAAHYLEVLPSHVPEGRRARAQEVVETVAASFNIPVPAITWFSEETCEEKKVRKECGECPWGGYFTRPHQILGSANIAEHKIWIHAHLADQNLTRTAVHETLHLALPEASEDQIEGYEATICSGS